MVLVVTKVDNQHFLRQNGIACSTSAATQSSRSGTSESYRPWYKIVPGGTLAAAIVCPIEEDYSQKGKQKTGCRTIHASCVRPLLKEGVHRPKDQVGSYVRPVPRHNMAREAFILCAEHGLGLYTRSDKFKQKDEDIDQTGFHGS